MKIINFGYIYQLTKFGDFMSCGSKDVFKNVPRLMYYTHRDVTDSVNHGIMFKNTRTWTSWDPNIIDKAEVTLNQAVFLFDQKVKTKK